MYNMQAAPHAPSRVFLFAIVSLGHKSSPPSVCSRRSTRLLFFSTTAITRALRWCGYSRGATFEYSHKLLPLSCRSPSFFFANITTMLTLLLRVVFFLLALFARFIYLFRNTVCFVRAFFAKSNTRVHRKFVFGLCQCFLSRFLFSIECSFYLSFLCCVLISNIKKCITEATNVSSFHLSTIELSTRVQKKNYIQVVSMFFLSRFYFVKNTRFIWFFVLYVNFEY